MFSPAESDVSFVGSSCGRFCSLSLFWAMSSALVQTVSVLAGLAVSWGLFCALIVMLTGAVTDTKDVDASGEDNGDFHPKLFNIRLWWLVMGGDSADCGSELLAVRPPGGGWLTRLESEAERENLDSRPVGLFWLPMWARLVIYWCSIVTTIVDVCECWDDAVGTPMIMVERWRLKMGRLKGGVLRATFVSGRQTYRATSQSNRRL